jgi:hypothetical protein
MGPIDFDDLAERALLLIDSAPIINVLEDYPQFGPRFVPLFAAHASGRLRFAVTTITVAEVLVGPLRVGDDALAQRFRVILDSWRPLRSIWKLRRAPRDCGPRSVSGWQTRCRRPAHWRSTPRHSSPTTGIFLDCALCGSFPDAALRLWRV